MSMLALPERGIVSRRRKKNHAAKVHYDRKEEARGTEVLLTNEELSSLQIDS
jgi:hypothetical protein